MALTSSGRVRAGAAIVALNAASGLLAPLRRRLTVASSHIVLTEPVPDVIEALGWTGGEAISDGRALLHYTRTTRDGRILFGWAGGRMACGARTDGRMEVDADVIAQARADLVRFFPGLAGRAVTHAWGGPIDVSPTHLPTIAALPGGRAWAAFGYTGNGVGPSHLLGRAMARVIGSTGRSCSSSRSLRTSAARISEPPAQRSGSGGNAFGCGSTSGSVVTSSRTPSASPERIRPPRCEGPTPCPVKPQPACTAPRER